MTTIREDFSSVESYYHAITTRQVTDAFDGAVDTGAMVIGESRKEFTETESWEEACKLLENGWVDGAKKIKAGTDRINTLQNSKRIRQEIMPVGFVPHIPNAIHGLANSMICQVKKECVNRQITINYFASVSYHFNSKRMINAGINILSAVKIAELSGIRVGVNILYACTDNDDNNIITTIKVKDHRQSLNMLKIAYPIAHPSFFRRHWFRWLETKDGVPHGFSGGYGIPVVLDSNSRKQAHYGLKRLKIIDETNLFTFPTEADKAKDGFDLLNKILGTGN